MRYSIFLLLSIFSFGAQAQRSVNVASTIQSVTVYSSGAQVNRVADHFLTSGRQVLVFTGLSSELDPASVGVSASDGVSVLSVSSKIDPTQQSEVPKDIRVLKDSLRTYQFDHRFNANMLGVYAEERKMILANQKVGWEKTEFIIEDLEDLSDFYRERLADIMLKEMELQGKQDRLSKNINRLNAALAEFDSKAARSKGQVLVEVLTPNNQNVDLTLSYMVRNAGWIPSYNVNASEVDQPLQVSYNAKVYQNSGEDWNNVPLTLTNANPNLSGNVPQLHPWKLYFIQRPDVLMQNAYSNKAMPMRAEMAAMELEADEDLGMSIEYPTNEVVTQFNIRTKHNIPSNGKPQAINIDVFTMQADFQYYTAPKLDPAAFLIAKVADFEQYELLPGEANLFLSNTYVGKTFLNTNTVKDTLDLSLGRDQSIQVERKKIKEFTSTKRIGGSTKESIGVEITVKNTKRTQIKLLIEDQVPISTDKEIEVSLQENGNARYSKSSGALKWTKVILDNSAESVRFIYDVKYPSDREINF